MGGSPHLSTPLATGQADQIDGEEEVEIAEAVAAEAPRREISVTIERADRAGGSHAIALPRAMSSEDIAARNLSRRILSDS